MIVVGSVSKHGDISAALAAAEADANSQAGKKDMSEVIFLPHSLSLLQCAIQYI